MSILDGILKNIGGAPNDVVNLAARHRHNPTVAGHAIAALGKTHQLDGGEGSLTHFAAMIDKDGDGNPLDDIMGMASGLLGGGKR